MKKRGAKDGVIIGSGEALLNLNSRDFKLLREKIGMASKTLSPLKKIEIRLLGIRYMMESYLEQEDPDKIILAGEFLKECVLALNIKHKEFAEYIEYELSNLSALYRGRRKINTDLALKFGRVFNISPDIWLNIQNKNELLDLFKSQKKKYKAYKLVDLVRDIK